MKKVFLFGAGAEEIFKICDGDEFAKAVLGINNKYNNAIKKFYKNNKDAWFPQCHIKNWKLDDLAKASLKKKWISLDNIPNFKKDFDDYIDNEIANFSENKKNKLIKEYSSYLGILDERFPTLIAPKALGPNNFWMVITCYWRAYLSIASSLLPGKEYDWIINNPKNSYDIMLENCSGYKGLESYYSILGKHKGSFDIKVITTNYTPLCSVISDIKEEDIAYLNGSFKWFERPKSLSVIDVTMSESELSNYDYFPFIFLQSATKPIVHPIQIQEWHKAIEFLDKDSMLYIIGYRANCDDNHINSLIREYLVKGNKVKYFAFETPELVVADVIKNYAMDYIPKDFEIVHIDRNNCFKVFEQEIMK